MLQRRVIVGQMAKRSLAAAATQSKSNAPQDAVVKTSRTSSGMLVTSIDRHGALSNVAIAFRAGARYEDRANLGVSHRVRDLIGQSSQDHSSFSLLWRSGMLGANLNTYTTRDLLVTNLQTFRDYAGPAMELIGELHNPGFRTWEFEDTVHMMKLERQLMKENAPMRCLDMLHSAAYRSGSLGHSIISPSYMIGKHSPAMIREFVATRFVSNEACVVGVNVDHEQLLAFAQNLPIAKGTSSKSTASAYLGGDVRKRTGDALTHVMIGGATGGGVGDMKSAATASVLGAILGNGTNVKFGVHSGMGKAAIAVSKVAKDAHGVTAFQTLNADCGLTGVYLVADADNIDGVVRAAVDVMRSVGGSTVSEVELTNARNSATQQALTQAETYDGIIEDAATQAFGGNDALTSADAIVKAIAGVTALDVQALAKQVMGKPSLSAVGAVDNVPYLDSL